MHIDIDTGVVRIIADHRDGKWYASVFNQKTLQQCDVVWTEVEMAAVAAASALSDQNAKMLSLDYTVFAVVALKKCGLEVIL